MVIIQDMTRPTLTLKTPNVVVAHVFTAAIVSCTFIDILGSESCNSITKMLSY